MAATLSDFVLSFPAIISRRFDSSRTPINGKGVVIIKYPSNPTVALVYLSAAFLLACIVAGLFSSLSCSKSTSFFVIINGNTSFCGNVFCSFQHKVDSVDYVGFAFVPNILKLLELKAKAFELWENKVVGAQIFSDINHLFELAPGTPINGKGVVIFKYPSDPTVALVYLSAAFLLACIVAGLFSSLPCSKSTSFFVIIIGNTSF
ncbi:hypothetical protein F2Q69_00028692 [Brassica cretica]|uniref:Uncharacterized protein n=1 Tax=Brassica cretica TaxID=69181 RepID=A0A8S9SA02_BRACR|nr:hypothetical protein F2Q69_00028692 [Brassica cretica]